MTQSFIKPGIRVVRGPDWSRGKQDGGEGFLGTVIFVPKPGATDDKVTVVWDTGRSLRYSAGKDSKYDLRVFDNAQIGITHQNKTCKECNAKPIRGFRWDCNKCSDVSLCTLCYMAGKHDTQHPFNRYDKEDSEQVSMNKRSASRTVESRGVCPKANVMPGPHWKWKNQDGSCDPGADVIEIVDWKASNSYRGGAKVRWRLSKKEVEYRLGGEGCVDLVVLDKTGAIGAKYYPDHLPVVDVVSKAGQVRIQLKNGDKVKVNMDVFTFKKLQSAVPGGWNDGMEQCTQEIGTIVELMADEETARVQYEDGQEWMVKRSALYRTHSFKNDDVVKILDNVNAIRVLQEGHGGWNDDMDCTLGQIGRIVRIDDDGDIRVRVGDKSWIFSPVCCCPVDDPKLLARAPSIRKDDDDGDDESETVQMNLLFDQGMAQLFELLLRAQGGGTSQDAVGVSIVEAAYSGQVEEVKKIVKASPDKIDEKVEGKTALQIAAHGGHMEIVALLLESKANVNIQDGEGDTALHYASFGAEPEVLRLLLDKGADKNTQNKKKRTALHVAVAKASPECLKVLVDKGCDVKIKDAEGDSVMHEAIEQTENQPDVVTYVLNSTIADFRVLNENGLNVLQWAVLKNNKSAVTTILKKNRGIVNITNAQGYAALHMAAANDFVEIAGALLSQGQADPNVEDNTKQTPLHLAVMQGHKRIIEVLVESGKANVNAQDEDGNTPLHVGQDQSRWTSLRSSVLRATKQDEAKTQITMFLLEKGADLGVRNNDGKSPLDLIHNETVKTMLQHIAAARKTSAEPKTKQGVRLPIHWEKMHGKPIQIVELKESDAVLKDELKTVEDHFRKTMPQSKIIKTQRVQNPTLWELYCIKRKSMEDEYGGGNANEVHLFHGTVPDKVDVICNQNFDFRLAGDRVGAIYGQGAYFASEAKYSDLYASADKNTRHKFMFVSKILAGKVCPGDAEYKRPPQISKADNKLYDSCVNNCANPTIYCVFDHNQMYPEYIVEYM